MPAREIDRVYREQDLLKSESAVLEDDGDGIPSQQPWRFQENRGRRRSRIQMDGCGTSAMNRKPAKSPNHMTRRGFLARAGAGAAALAAPHALAWPGLRSEGDARIRWRLRLPAGAREVSL